MRSIVFLENNCFIVKKLWNIKKVSHLSKIQHRPKLPRIEKTLLRFRWKFTFPKKFSSHVTLVTSHKRKSTHKFHRVQNYNNSTNFFQKRIIWIKLLKRPEKFSTTLRVSCRVNMGERNIPPTVHHVAANWASALLNLEIIGCRDKHRATAMAPWCFEKYGEGARNTFSVTNTGQRIPLFSNRNWRWLSLFLERSSLSK